MGVIRARVTLLCDWNIEPSARGKIELVNGDIGRQAALHEGGVVSQFGIVAGKMVKQRIEMHSNHVRRLSPEELRRIEGWLNNRKQGKGDGLHKLDTDELIDWVITSTHKDDDHDPLSEDAQERLTKGDQFIYRNKPIDAAVEYMFGRDIEPGNPKLKHRLEVTRR